MASNILRANEDLEAVKNIDWTLTVIDSEEQDPFVLPVSHPSCVFEYLENYWLSEVCVYQWIKFTLASESFLASSS